MTDQPEAEYESVRILRLQPGDVIVVRIADRIDKPAAEAIRDDLKPKFPDHEVLVLGPDADLEIVRDGDSSRCRWYTDGNSWALWAGPPAERRCTRSNGHQGPHE
jgi:hypothetical protein